MALDQAANFVVDELQSSVSDTATTFSVADASQFPDPVNGEYNLVVFDATRPSKDADVEVVRVTGHDTTNDELTVTRGQETTTAASHASGTAVELSYTAKFRDDIQTEIDNAGGTTVTSLIPTEAIDGEEPTASGDKALAIGVGKNLFEDSITKASAQTAIAIGNGARAEGLSSIAVGDNTRSDGEKSVVLGRGTETLADESVVIGNESNATFSSKALVAGSDAAVDGNRSTAIGAGTEVIGTRSTALGYFSSVDGDYSVAIGNATSVSTSDVARIGTKQTVIGAVDGGQIADADLNNSELTFELDEANSNIVFRVKNSSGTVKTGTVNLS